MMQRSSSGTRPNQRGRLPELPRDTVDTRMPAAPAPGGKVIAVGRPSGRVRKSELDGGVLLGALGAALVLAIVWRLTRRRGLQQRVL
jgi:hypothetical protein